MALINPSMLGEVRGSIGGATFSRNRSGAYIRKRATPVNPNTPRQNDARARMTNLAILWTTTLTQDQRDAWDEYAANVASTNKLGDSINLTGINWYVSTNALILQAGGDRIDDAPTLFERALSPDNLVVSASEATQQVSFGFDDGEDWANEDGGFCLVFLGLPQNASRNFFNGPFRFMDAVEGAALAAPGTPQLMDVPFPIAEGQKLFVEALVIRADGRTSVRVREVFLAAA